MMRLALLVVLAGLACTCAAPASPRVASPVNAATYAALAATADSDAGAHVASATVPATNPAAVDPFARIDALVSAAIAEGKLPGCVVVIGRHDETRVLRAYGDRAVLPERAPMRADTVFDVASLTKPVATAASLMVLVDQKRVDLDAPAARYVPELAPLPAFTVTELLLHTSGLPAATGMSDYEHGRTAMLARFAKLTLKARPGERFLYSDVGYIVLEEIVRRVSGQDLATFAREHVFLPLNMPDTRFLPDAAQRARAATTEQRDGAWMVGDVHDPRAFRLGGVAGNAGLFSTGTDLARFAQAVLRHGTGVASDRTVRRFTRRYATPKGGRGLGWDVDSVFASHKGALLSPLAFGHGGYTGTALWIDPDKDLFVVFLSNRVHPDGKGAVNPLVASIADAAVDALAVKNGIDVLSEESFARLAGARVGLLTNLKAARRDGTSTIDAFKSAAGLQLVTLFSPEHGLDALAEGRVRDSTFGGVPVKSLYGASSSPSDDALAGIDTLVVDLQDAGLRWYTYEATMTRALLAAERAHLRFVVLDRPNPLGGEIVEGPVWGDAPGALASPLALPIRHGLTMGELAGFFATEEHLATAPEVVLMRGWQRAQRFEGTALPWPAPSPNLRSPRGVALYPAVGLLEATNVSVGRGTEEPFEIVGAPWVDGAALLKRVQSMHIAGIEAERAEFTPTVNPHAGKTCHGVRLRVTDADAFRAVHAGVALAVALHDVHATPWAFDHLDRMLHSPVAIAAIRLGAAPDAVEATWSEPLAAFDEKRHRFFLYP